MAHRLVEAGYLVVFLFVSNDQLQTRQLFSDLCLDLRVGLPPGCHSLETALKPTSRQSVEKSSLGPSRLPVSLAPPVEVLLLSRRDP